MKILLKAWSDSLENELSAAFGYKPIAIGSDREVDSFIVDNQQVLTKASHGWACPEGAPLYRSEELPDMSELQVGPCP